jgi:hypothetical protein
MLTKQKKKNLKINNMKKLLLKTIIAITLIVSSIPLSYAGVGDKNYSNSISKSTQENQELLTRLYEIDALDKSNLKSSEKRQLRKEVRTIKHKILANNGGVYISVGALILILILLIILI